MWYWLFWLILESVPSVFHGVMRLWDPVFFVVLKMWEQGPCTDVRRQIVLKWIWVFQGVVAIGKKFLRFIDIVEGLRIELSVRAHTWPPWSRRASSQHRGKRYWGESDFLKEFTAIKIPKNQHGFSFWWIYYLETGSQTRWLTEDPFNVFKTIHSMSKTSRNNYSV